MIQDSPGRSGTSHHGIDRGVEVFALTPGQKKNKFGKEKSLK